MNEPFVICESETGKWFGENGQYTSFLADAKVFTDEDTTPNFDNYDPISVKEAYSARIAELREIETQEAKLEIGELATKALLQSFDNGEVTVD